MDDKAIDKDDMLNLEIPEDLLKVCIEQGLFIDTGTKNENGLPVYMFTDETVALMLKLIEEDENQGE